MSVDAGLRCQDAHGQLLAAHLQAEHAGRSTVLGSVQAHVQGQSALAQRGPRPQDNEIGALQARQELVQLAETGHHRAGRGGQRLDDAGTVLEILVIDLPQRHESTGLSRPAHGEQGVLRLPERPLDVIGVVVAQLGDACRRRDEPPHHGGAGDNLGVVLGVDGCRCDGHEVRQICRSTDGIQLFGPRQFFGQSGMIDGLVPLEEVNRRVVAKLVPLPVEVAGLQQRRNAGNALAIDQERADERLLRLDAMREQSFGVEGHGYSSASAVTWMVAAMSVENRSKMSYSPGSRIGSATSIQRRSTSRPVVSVRAMEM